MAQKCSWHENEEQMDNAIHHMLQSCGVQARNYLRTGKMNLTYQASKELFGLANISDVTISQRMNYFSNIIMHGSARLGIQTSRSFQFWSRQSCTGKKLSQKSGVHQVVANCCSCNIFPKFKKFRDPPFAYMSLIFFIIFLFWFDLRIIQKDFSNN